MSPCDPLVIVFSDKVTMLVAFVCLSASNITQNLINGLQGNFMERSEEQMIKFWWGRGSAPPCWLPVGNLSITKQIISSFKWNVRIVLYDVRNNWIFSFIYLFIYFIYLFFFWGGGGIWITKLTLTDLCVEVLGKTSHTRPPLSTQQWWVPGGTKKWRIVKCEMALWYVISCRKCAEFSPEEMRPYKSEFRYQGCKLCSLLNSAEGDIKTINIHIYLFIFIFTLQIVNLGSMGIMTCLVRNRLSECSCFWWHIYMSMCRFRLRYVYIHY